jgi:hypothetical protein
MKIFYLICWRDFLCEKFWNFLRLFHTFFFEKTQGSSKLSYFETVMGLDRNLGTLKIVVDF